MVVPSALRIVRLRPGRRVSPCDLLTVRLHKIDPLLQPTVLQDWPNLARAWVEVPGHCPDPRREAEG